ncbi:Hypothetical protein PHPALM_21014 [Phytophthora palmivora]|uniref:Uncharacterized protein n=1 Tax=Phytophthora palmivora TaxID=4796 RepID=A0A2P4XDD2_9STRA|nr:Hypothetical protein PHPALM_21014 [Phytophthora palmivora]
MGQLKRASIAEGTLGPYSKNFKRWESFCTEFDFRCGLTNCPGHNKHEWSVNSPDRNNRSGKGNKYQTFDRKMTVVAFAHKAVQNVRSSGPEAAGYYTDVAEDAETPRITRTTSYTAVGIDRLGTLKALRPCDHCQLDRVTSEGKSVHTVEVVFGSHNGDHISQGVTIRHYKSDNSIICPVEAARRCLSVRASWEATGKKLGPYLTSIKSNPCVITRKLS